MSINMKQLIVVIWLGIFTSACVPYVDTMASTPTPSPSFTPTIIIPQASLTPVPSATVSPLSATTTPKQLPQQLPRPSYQAPHYPLQPQHRCLFRRKLLGGGMTFRDLRIFCP